MRDHRCGHDRVCLVEERLPKDSVPYRTTRCVDRVGLQLKTLAGDGLLQKRGRVFKVAYESCMYTVCDVSGELGHESMYNAHA